VILVVPSIQAGTASTSDFVSHTWIVKERFAGVSVWRCLVFGALFGAACFTLVLLVKQGFMLYILGRYFVRA